MTEAANVAGSCRDGVLPVAGGLVDQSAWFIDVWQAMRSEHNRLEQEELERLKRGRKH